MIGMAPQLAATDYADPARLGAIGLAQGGQSQAQLADKVARFNFYQQRPSNMLNNYIGQIQGLPITGGSKEIATPLYENPVASGLGGAFAGAQLANMINPKVGPQVVSPWLGALGGAGLSLLG
jgi:hypothetical protein